MHRLHRYVTVNESDRIILNDFIAPLLQGLNDSRPQPASFAAIQRVALQQCDECIRGLTSKEPNHVHDKIDWDRAILYRLTAHESLLDLLKDAGVANHSSVCEGLVRLGYLGGVLPSAFNRAAIWETYDRPDLSVRHWSEISRWLIPQPDEALILHPRSLWHHQFGWMLRFSHPLASEELMCQGTDLRPHILELKLVTKANLRLIPRLITKFVSSGTSVGQLVKRRNQAIGEREDYWEGLEADGYWTVNSPDDAYGYPWVTWFRDLATRIESFAANNRFD